MQRIKINLNMKNQLQQGPTAVQPILLTHFRSTHNMEQNTYVIRIEGLKNQTVIKNETYLSLQLVSLGLLTSGQWPTKAKVVEQPSERGDTSKKEQYPLEAAQTEN